MFTVMDKKDIHIELTEDGFMINRRDWDEKVAEILAEKEDII